MKIFLVRHGQTTGDIEERYGGDYDDELTEKGVEQATTLAEKLVGKNISVIYSSSKKRAEQTAEIISKKINVGLEIIGNFRERNNYGVLSGLTKTEAKEQFPFEVKELEEKSPQHSVKGSEDYQKFKDRVVRAFHFVVNATDANCLIVTHSGPIRRILADTIGKEVASVDDCALVELEKSGEEYKLVESNGIVFKEYYLKKASEKPNSRSQPTSLEEYP